MSIHVILHIHVHVPRQSTCILHLMGFGVHIFFLFSTHYMKGGNSVNSEGLHTQLERVTWLDTHAHEGL